MSYSTLQKCCNLLQRCCIATKLILFYHFVLSVIKLSLLKFCENLTKIFYVLNKKRQLYFKLSNYQYSFQLFNFKPYQLPLIRFSVLIVRYRIVNFFNSKTRCIFIQRRACTVTFPCFHRLAVACVVIYCDHS